MRSLAVALAVAACTIACGGARPAPPTAMPAVASVPSDAAPDAADECASRDSVDGPKLAGGRTTIEICVIHADQHSAGWMIYDKRATLVFWPASGEPAGIALGDWREEHDEYYEAMGYELLGAIGDVVIVRRRFGFDEIDGYQLVDGSWSNLGHLASGERVEVVFVDAKTAELRSCTVTRDEGGRAIGECTPGPMLKATWTGKTVEVYP